MGRTKFNMKPTHKVLDLVYTPDEGQECFEGTEEQCYDFINKQGDATFMYKVVPIVNSKQGSSLNLDCVFNPRQTPCGIGGNE